MILVRSIIKRVTHHVPGIGSGGPTLFQQDLTIHHGVMNSLGYIAHPPSIIWQIMHNVLCSRSNGVGIEDDEVRCETWLQ
jgi:hypothetical protein